MMKRVTTPLQWLKVYMIYRSSFPDSERKPFSIIRRMHKKGKTDVWCFEKNKRIVGMASTINSDALILLDYFAISESFRGQGTGTVFLKEIIAQYDDKGLFVEIERTGSHVESAKEKQRRKQFYMSCGLDDLHVTANVFGVEMELLGRHCSMSFDDYHSFYKNQYSAYAADHILPLKE